MSDRDGIAAALRLAAIVDSSDDAIVSKDLNGIVMSWNRGAERIFGFTAEEIIGKSITQIIPADRRAEEDDVLRRIRSGESVDHFETVRRRKDGTFVPVSLTISPIRAHDGTVVGASKIARDISDRQSADALVADLQRRLLTLIAASGSLLGSPRLDDVLPATLKLANELLSADGYAIWRLDQAESSWKIVVASGISDEFANRMVDGRQDHLGLTLAEPWVVEEVQSTVALADRQEAYRREGIASMLILPVMATNGEVAATLVAYYRTRRRFTDVEVQTARALGNLAAAATTTAELYDDQRRSREAAERVNRRAAYLSEISAVLAGSLDYETTLRTAANLAVPHIADWCTVDIVDERGRVKRLAAAHIDPAKVEEARALLERFEEGEELPHTIHQVVRTGRPVLLREIPGDAGSGGSHHTAYLRSLRDLGFGSYISVPLLAHGRTLGALTFVTVGSSRHYGAEDLRFAEDVAYRAALAVDNARAYRQMSAANRAKDEFLATLSHELRTPLNAVLGWSRMLREGRVRDDRRAHAIEVIERNAEAQLRLVEDLLDVSRIITGKFRLDVQRVDLAVAIEAAIEAVQPAASAKEIRLQKILDPNAGPVYGDVARLQQVIWNLLANAVKFTPRGGRVQVSLLRDNSHLEIDVSDTGDGLAPEVLPFVFDRFRQADSGPSRGQAGLGLGLAIVRHIVELHGGVVSASSPGLGLGSTFRIVLPVTVTLRNTRGRLVHPSVSETPETMVPSLLQGVRILVVENDADARELIANLLSNCDADVTAVESAGDALSSLDARVPDVILSDIEMPFVDGYEFIRQVRSRGQGRGGGVAAIALTAYARPEDRARSLRSGFQAHLSKPVDFNELIAAIASLSRKGDWPHELDNRVIG
jgi:PAS domain S-box-containing protein